MSRSRKNLTWIVQVVNVKNPPITSPASLALLSKKYFALDKTIYTERRMSKIRNRWMKEQLKHPDKKGGLTCNICGKQGLLPHKAGKYNMATLDHKIRIKDGGSWFDTSNFQVLCFQCNNNKH